ncbi:MAG: hypothetical protein ABIH71_06530 [Candidatus Omnitrophota bacterium]
MKTNIIMTKSEILRSLLTPLWLRPESALWYSHMLYVAKKFLGEQILGPSLEFGCMDGVNTVVLLGGKFGESFDVYQEVSWDKDSHKRSTLGDDYFNTTGDIEFKSVIEQEPTSKFDYGIGFKDAHIKKSQRLGVFNELLKIDLENPVIPLEPAQIMTIWAPNIYWSPNLSATLGQLQTILHPQGRIITIAPDTNQLNFAFYRFFDRVDGSWLKDLDRGRYENASRCARTLQQWGVTFGDKGLKIVRQEMFIPSIVAQTYDVGLRPMFPVFMNMYEKLRMFNQDDLLDLKRHWIDTAHHFLSPLCNDQWMKNMDKAWHIFELRRV